MSTVLDVLRECTPHGSSEIKKNESLARILCRAGFRCEERKRGFDIVADVWVVEGKLGLTKSADIHRAIGQIREYIRTDLRGRTLYYVSYSHIDADALHSLEQELTGLWITYQIVDKGMTVVKDSERESMSYRQVYSRKHKSQKPAKTCQGSVGIFGGPNWF